MEAGVCECVVHFIFSHQWAWRGVVRMGQEEQHLELPPLLLCVSSWQCQHINTWAACGKETETNSLQVHQSLQPCFLLSNSKSIRKWEMGKSCLMLFQSIAGQYPVRPVFQAQGCRKGFLHTHRANIGVPQTPYLQTGTTLKKLIAKTILTLCSPWTFLHA